MTAFNVHCDIFIMCDFNSFCMSYSHVISFICHLDNDAARLEGEINQLVSEMQRTETKNSKNK